MQLTTWGKVGTAVNGTETSQDAMTQAGMAWEVALEPTFTQNGERLDVQAVRRSDNGAILGTVGPRFHPLQNAESFAWFDPFVRSGEASYETAGILREGARVWILARLNRDDAIIVPRSDDKVRKYLLLSNSHDGSLSVRVGFTPIRVVCENTLAAAHADGRSHLLRIRHTKNVRETVELVREAVNSANAQFEASADLYRRMAAREINSEDLGRYVRAVFRSERSETSRVRARAELASKRAAEMAHRGVIALGPAGGFLEESEERDPRALPEVTRLFSEGIGNWMPGVRGTMWAAYNAVAEYLQHSARGTAESRLDSLAWGAAAKRSKLALDTALSMC